MRPDRHHRGFTRRARNISIMLAAEFLLGMVLNLWGTSDPGAPAWRRYLDLALLSAHIFLGLGICLGAAMLIVISWKEQRRGTGLPVAGGAGVLAAFTAGILTVTAPWGDLWSFLMAIGFIGSLIIYAKIWAIGV